MINVLVNVLVKLFKIMRERPIHHVVVLFIGLNDAIFCHHKSLQDWI